MVGLVNPFRQRICPYCGESLYPGNCAVVSGVNNNILHKPREGFLPRLFVQPMRGLKYAKSLAARQCPNPKCQKLLPYNIEHADSYTIAIVGDSTSGKSHYIASCINQLKQLPTLQVIGCSRLVAQGDTDQKYRDNYYSYIYTQKLSIPPTPQARTEINEPLIYELVFQAKSLLRPARRVNLLFYDSSGEDLIHQDRMVQYGQYVLNASAIIFLADPLAMPRVVAALPAHLRPNFVREDSTSDVLNRIMQTFEMGQGIRPGSRLKTPIAITISKSDLLKFVLKGGPSPFFLSDTAYASKLDGREFEIVNQEVRYFLQSMGDQILVHSSQAFEDVNFFAVSATGWPMDASNKYPTIEPLRCLDPLLWALARIKVITPD